MPYFQVLLTKTYQVYEQETRKSLCNKWYRLVFRLNQRTKKALIMKGIVQCLVK